MIMVEAIQNSHLLRQELGGQKRNKKAQITCIHVENCFVLIEN